MDIGTGIALGTLVIGAAIPVTSYIVTSRPAPTNGDKPMTQALCDQKHKTIDVEFRNLSEKMDMILDHFNLKPKG